jgi:hypothetical protein
VKFRTEVIPDPAGFKISHEDHVVLIGSCFSSYIGERLENHGYTTQINPHGILFNPISVSRSINDIVSDKSCTVKDLFCDRQKIYRSWHHHSQWSSMEVNELLSDLTNANHRAHDFLKSAHSIFLTLGTSYVYELVENDEIVANCHKLPSDKFRKRILHVSEILENLKQTINGLLSINPKINVVFTVSPVRHLKDGIQENSRSKAILLDAVHHLSESSDHIFYFPSYEIMMDDLRDYRFYSKDMIHPNEQAIDYIWNIFSETYFSQETIEINKQVHKLRQSCLHRPLNPDSAQNIEFRHKLEKDLEQFKEKSGIDILKTL